MKCPFCDEKIGGKTYEVQCADLATHLHWIHFDDKLPEFIEWLTGETQPWDTKGTTLRWKATWCGDFMLRAVREKGVDAVRQAMQAWEIGGS